MEYHTYEDVEQTALLSGVTVNLTTADGLDCSELILKFRHVVGAVTRQVLMERVAKQLDILAKYPRYVEYRACGNHNFALKFPATTCGLGHSTHFVHGDDQEEVVHGDDQEEVD